MNNNKKTCFVFVLCLKNMCQSALGSEVKQKSRVGREPLLHSRIAGESSGFVSQKPIIKCGVTKCIAEDSNWEKNVILQTSCNSVGVGRCGQDTLYTCIYVLKIIKQPETKKELCQKCSYVFVVLNVLLYSTVC